MPDLLGRPTQSTQVGEHPTFETSPGAASDPGFFVTSVTTYMREVAQWGSTYTYYIFFFYYVHLP